MPKNNTGNHKSDSPKSIDQQEVLQIIQKRIDILEEKENRILTQGAFEDDFAFLEEEHHVSDNYPIADHVNNTTSIMELKSIYRQIEKL